MVTQDLNRIRSKCWGARNKWMEIGLELKLTKSDLDAIQERYKDNVGRCFTEMLDSWLRTISRPTLADLIAALRQQPVGFNQLAEDLEREGLKNNRTIYQNTIKQFAIETGSTSLHTCQTSNTNLAYKVNIVKQVTHSLATRVVVIAIFLALLSGPSFTNIHVHTCICISPKDCNATGKGLEEATTGERELTQSCTLLTKKRKSMIGM